MLPSQNKWTYGPAHLAEQNGDGRLAWCEGARGKGVGQTITMRVDGGVPFRRLWIGNGYGKTRKSYTENGRLRRVRITTDLGVDATVELPDQSDARVYELPEPFAQRWVRLKILSVYPGSKYRDTCLDFLAPDMEYEEELLQQQQMAAPQAPALPVPSPQAPAVPTPDFPDLPPPSGGTPQDDPFGDLGFPDDDDLDLN